MPEQDTDDQPVIEEEVEEEVEETEAETATEKPDKRISDLQSARDKEEARANKLQKQLDALTKAGSDEGTKPGDKDPEREALRSELREVSLDAVYAEFEELKGYDISRDLIEGATRAEMRESATALVSLAKRVASKERNRVMKEFGVKADPSGSTRQPPKNFAEMSDEEIDKEIARSRSGGGASLW